jgi:transposase-like protein
MAGKKSEKPRPDNPPVPPAASPGGTGGPVYAFNLRPRKLSGPGRPSKLQPKTIEKLVLALQSGNTLATACNFAEIDYSTLRKWVKRAEEDQAKGLRTEYFDFFQVLTRAQAEAEIFHVSLIREAAQGGKPRRHVRTTKEGVVIEETELTAPDWRASAFLLERRYPASWGKTVHQKVDFKPRNVEEMDEAELDAYELELEALKARLLGQAK